MGELLIQDKQLFSMASKEFYEPMSRYQPLLGDYHAQVRRLLPPDWRIDQHNVWWGCNYEGAQIPAQGWKIHLSATPAHSPAILMTVARMMIERRVTFKFLVDRTMLHLSNGKRWSRGAAGKFITVYPTSTEHCAELLEDLHRATIGYWGPYILSDRRYKDSRIVHYRYGGLLPVKRLDVSGRTVHVIQDQDGNYIDDERTPFFHLPDGVHDPFEQPAAASVDEGEDGTLCKGRYEVREVLASSNPGSVYLAWDRHSERQVVIKEGRPYTNVSARGLDAMQLLKKEHRLLGLIADLEIAPKPLDFFLDWEHAYLVEEYLEGSHTLRGHLLQIGLLLRTRPTVEYAREYYRRYRHLFIELAKMVKALHDRDIVFSDLSMANVMVFMRDSDDHYPTLKLIDFEGAYEEGIDLPTHLMTPGFSTQQAADRGMSTKRDDYYSIGGLMMAGLFPMNSLLVLDRDAHRRYIDACRRDFDLPDDLAELILALLHPDEEQRPGMEHVIEVLSVEHEPREPNIGTYELDQIDLDQTIERILGYADSVADFERSDRLYPADALVFDTNPLSIAHGACGVAYVMQRARGAVDPRVIEWIRAQNLNIKGRTYSPGLYTGLAGIAWSMLELGLRDEAIEAIEHTRDHRLLWNSPTLFDGASGWGMAQLRFFRETGDQAYLDAARKVGNFLIESREVDPELFPGCFWNAPEGVSSSLAHGAAGIALFLLYLHCATGEERFLATGRQAIEWVMHKSVRNVEGGLTWRARDRTATFTPYWRWGSSGIGRVLLRYWHATGDAAYAEPMEHIHIECDRKYTIFPGYFFGIAGIAEMYLDMARFPRWETMALAATRRLLAGAMLFPVERAGGLAFPGESLTRISCDFGTGGAGVALVMDRYRKRDGASFMLDELLPDWAPQDRPEPACEALS